MDKGSVDTSQKREIAVKGIPASPGIAIGPVFVYSEPILAPEMRFISKENVPNEIKRFKNAIKASRSHLNKVYKEAKKSYSQEFADIIQSQISILEDKIFLEEVEQLIEENLYDAPYATFKVFRNKKEHFLELSDDYFRERAFDIQNLKRLILKNLLGKKEPQNITKRSIVVADNLSPADTIRLHHKHILGFCTNVGGKNSHTAIIARSLGVPAIVGTKYITSLVKTGNQIIIDGNEGIITVNPSSELVESYQNKKQQFLVIEKDLLKKAHQPAETEDEKQIEVLANIEFIEELDNVVNSGAEGIGLYRTEGLFLGKNGLPTEDEQTQKYSQVAKTIKPNQVVIRTLDVGGDKILPDLVGIPERNPFLGWRAIRFCLDHKEIFLPQLKAILRANVHQNVQILLPMVSSLEEVRQFRVVLEEAKEKLKAEKKKFNPELKIGMMVEIPSAAILAAEFANEIDFFSIGTNDLVQYTLAVDRANEKISHLYNHFHPSLLVLIKHVIDVGKQWGKPVSMCGEMAGDPVAVPLLVGMGLEHFSAGHIVIPEIKNLIRNIAYNDCEDLYQSVKNVHTATEVQKICEDFYSTLFTVSSNNNNNQITSDDK